MKIGSSEAYDKNHKDLLNELKSLGVAVDARISRMNNESLRGMVRFEKMKKQEPTSAYNVDFESVALKQLSEAMQKEEKKIFEELIQTNKKHTDARLEKAKQEPMYISSVEEFDKMYGTPKTPPTMAVPPGVYDALKKIGEQDANIVKTGDMVAQLKKAIDQLGNETVLRTLVHAQGRRLNGDADVKRILDYMHRNSIPVYKEFEQKDIEADSIDELVDRLEQLPGVKTTILNDSYPETASIIVKVDYRALDDDELNEISGRILATITKYKPVGLDELEVIYHNKEVY